MVTDPTLELDTNHLHNFIRMNKHLYRENKTGSMSRMLRRNRNSRECNRKSLSTMEAEEFLKEEQVMHRALHLSRIMIQRGQIPEHPTVQTQGQMLLIIF